MSLSNKELLDKIKDEVAKENGFEKWDDIIQNVPDDHELKFWPIVCERYATEKAKEVINFPENKNEQINYFLVNILRYLDADQALTLAKNLIGRIPQTEYFTRSEVESCIKDSLEAAAENAKVSPGGPSFSVDKSSITDTKNIKIK